MSKKDVFSACIIGAGSIGAMKPDHLDSIYSYPYILTHANACYQHKNIFLAGIVDSDKEKAKSAAHKWNTKSFCDLEDPLLNQIDIFIVATPTETHKEVLLKILKYNPQVVIAEKPFCSSSLEAEEVHKIYASKNIPILVNYMRNFNEEIKSTCSDISKGVYGKIYSVTCHYVRGLKHEGSHFLSFCNKTFGKFILGGILKDGNHYDDRDELDESSAVFMSFANCKHILMLPVDSREAFNTFRIEVTTQKGNIIFQDRGNVIEIYPVIKEPIYGNYNTLSSIPSTKTYTGLSCTLLSVIDEVVDYLINFDNTKLSCTSLDAVKVHKIYEKIRYGGEICQQKN